MKTERLLSLVPIVLLASILLGGCASGKYVPTANEQLYGTWINEKSINQFHVQKAICTSDGWKEYYNISDTFPLNEGTREIVSKWVDDNGNIWYKTFSTITFGKNTGLKGQELNKLSKSCTVWESVVEPVGEFNSSSFPKKIDPNNWTYNILYRAEK